MFNLLKKALCAISVIIACIAPCTPTVVSADEPTDFPPAGGGK